MAHGKQKGIYHLHHTTYSRWRETYEYASSHDQLRIDHFEFHLTALDTENKYPAR